MLPTHIRIKDNELPDTPGVYLMKNAQGGILYVGKATSLKRRVQQHFLRPHNNLIEEMIKLVAEIDYIQKPTALEALILEANLIKLYWPKYNTDQKDNKSFLYLVITEEAFPRPLLIRGREIDEQDAKKYKAVFGPYTSGRSLRAALDIIRKAIPWSTCVPPKEGKTGHACFYVHLKMCPGVCAGLVTRSVYAKTIRDLIRFFEGKKEEILKRYRREMEKAAKEKRFEDAAEWRNKVFALEHIQDVAVLRREDDLDSDDVESAKKGREGSIFGRIEGYDISHVSGTSTVASMVVFEQGAPAKAQYRKFRIRWVEGANDVASIQEVLQRRFTHPEWRRPSLLLIDGGLPQVHAAQEVLTALGLVIPIIGIAKGPERKRNDIILTTNDAELRAACEKHHDILEAVRDEAHRFAIQFHRSLRSRRFLGKTI
ncbi:GIY-YIG nuclease family protein [Patescibacteria group bacterium]|nr:GIY-YIG nuclease family protein [Patescibacteria group bacterium]